MFNFGIISVGETFRCWPSEAQSIRIVFGHCGVRRFWRNSTTQAWTLGLWV